MAQRKKRSISLPPELATLIEAAAEESGMTVSAWIAAVAEHSLRLEAGRRAVADWEAEHGALTPEEIERARARLLETLGRAAPERAA